MAGKCYPNSFALLEKLHLAGQNEQDLAEKSVYRDLRLIHGTIAPDSKDVDHRIDHAWVEMSGYAYEASESFENPSADLISSYRSNYAAIVRAIYDYPTACRLKEQTGIYGPWDEDGIRERASEIQSVTGKLLPPPED
jgi:hypothetical protein